MLSPLIAPPPRPPIILPTTITQPPRRTMPRPGSLRGPEFAPGSIDATRLSIQGTDGVAIAQFTTTDTTQFVRAVTGTLRVPGLGLAMDSPVVVQVKHSAANAHFSIYFSVYTTADYTGSNFSTFLFGLDAADALLIAGGVANEWDTVAVPGLLYPDANGIAPGTRAYDLVVYNRTAGTLTVSTNDLYEFVAWSFRGYKPA